MSSIADKPRAELPDLILGLRARDDKSYEELVRRYGGRMLSVAIRIVGNPEDARECVQEAFLQVFKNIEQFEGRSSVWTWLHRIVVNSALLKLRSRRRRPEGLLMMTLTAAPASAQLIAAKTHAIAMGHHHVMVDDWKKTCLSGNPWAVRP